MVGVVVGAGRVGSGAIVVDAADAALARPPPTVGAMMRMQPISIAANTTRTSAARNVLQSVAVADLTVPSRYEARERRDRPTAIRHEA